MKTEKRFIVSYKQSLGTCKIIVDKETGVNYLFSSDGYSGGLTVLVDKDGKPITSSLSELENME